MLRSIPNITSTGPSRSPRIRNTSRQVQPSKSSQRESSWEYQVQEFRPVRPGRVKRNSGKIFAPLFPEKRGKPEIIEDKERTWVIVEFPGHQDIAEVKWSLDGQTLTVASIIYPPYLNEITLPENNRGGIEVGLRNGIFSAKFKK